MKILIVKLSAIGDVVHSLPVLHGLRKAYPSARIDWLVEEAASSLLQGHPLLDELIISKRKSWLKALKEGDDRKRACSEITAFVRRLRKTEYDIIVDLHALLKSSLLIFFARGKRKVGYASGDEGSSIFLNEKISPFDIEQHAVLRYMNLAHYLGAPKNDQYFFPIPVSNADKLTVKQILANNKMKGPFITMNPMAKWESKLWDERKFAELADRCIRELKIPVIFTGGKEDVEVKSIIEQMHETAVNLCGRTNLRELSYLYSLSRVMVTTDTGPMHIAAASGTRVIALFGPTAPWRTGPFGEGHTVIRKDLPCSPCFKKKCSDLRCMRNIEVDEVFQAIRQRI